MHNVQPQKRKGKFPSSFLTILRFFKDNSGFWRCHVILLNIFFQIFKFQCELIELSLTFSENGSSFFPFFLAWNSLFLCVSWHLLYYYYYFLLFPSFGLLYGDLQNPSPCRQICLLQWGTLWLYQSLIIFYHSWSGDYMAQSFPHMLNPNCTGVLWMLKIKKFRNSHNPNLQLRHKLLKPSCHPYSSGSSGWECLSWTLSQKIGGGGETVTKHKNKTKLL